jgi:hypothetical protein
MDCGRPSGLLPAPATPLLRPTRIDDRACLAQVLPALVVISRTWLALWTPALAIPRPSRLTVLYCALSLQGEENGDPLVCDRIVRLHGVPEICQKLRYAQPHPPRVSTPRQRLWSTRLCGHVGCCAVS